MPPPPDQTPPGPERISPHPPHTPQPLPISHSSPYPPHSAASYLQAQYTTTPPPIHRLTPPNAINNPLLNQNRAPTPSSASQPGFSPLQAERISPQTHLINSLGHNIGSISPLNQNIGPDSIHSARDQLLISGQGQSDRISPQGQEHRSTPPQGDRSNAPTTGDSGNGAPMGVHLGVSNALEQARKRRRKREDPQSCFGSTNIELSEDESGDDELQQDNTRIQDGMLHNSDSNRQYQTSETTRRDSSTFEDETASNNEMRGDQLRPGDVEQFEGRIVYNPDGSAYIIEDSDLSEDGSLPGLRDGCIIDGRGLQAPPSVPKVDSAHYLAAPAPAPHLSTPPPVMHSFRVLSARDVQQDDQNRTPSTPNKPILMCFVCKLSFGHAKAFASHASQDHSLDLSEDELKLLARESASAIVQRGGDSQKLVVSFLEPLEPALPPQQPQPVQQQIQLSVKSQQQLLQQSFMNRKSPSMSPPGNLLSHLQQQQHNLNAAQSLAMQNLQNSQNLMSGTTIGACPEHITTGRPIGTDCQRCEIMLGRLGVSTPNQNQSQQTPPHSRNSCKTLKCPKCNWHYKYQETLEIHMKEKHPDGESACAFCLAGQPHPRLARGETYTCGYKPYRCEVCNYSTTTKGNLSIHMQSDKHLNNMQELQSSGGQSNITSMNHENRGTSPKIQPPSMLQQPPQSQINSNKPKPTFRCDVCSYETGVARNLRIHMTSEKHTHNMAVLQQNVKHLQALSALHMQQQHQQLANVVDQQQIPTAEAALADMAYSQALMIQLMTGGAMPSTGAANMAVNSGTSELPPHLDLGLNPEAMEPPPEPADPEPSFLYSCLVCGCFHTDNLEQLGLHLAQDRTRSREQDVLSLINGHYVCRLCSYKTNLKANFQLHCKTDKHLQRLQHVNHVREGGPRNEWKLKYPSAGSVQLRCHACDYYTNSAHKLQMHAAGGRHDAARTLFRYLTESASNAVAKSEFGGGKSDYSMTKTYLCRLCGHRAANKLQLLQHVRSMMHLRMEHQHQLMKRADGSDGQTDLADVFHVVLEKQEPMGMYLYKLFK